MSLDREMARGRRYWVLGGRWVDGQRHLPWPRVYGPFPDYDAACASAGELNGLGPENARYLVVADVDDEGQDRRPMSGFGNSTSARSV